MARVFFGLALLFLVIGVVVWALERVGLRPGHMPGDIVAGSGSVRFYFPIVTCIVLSVILSLIMWVVGSVRR